MKIKFNWGTGIIIACLIFMSVTIITGITFMNQKVDLVDTNYYEKELKYQDHIDKVNRSETAGNMIDLKSSPGVVTLVYNDSLNHSSIKGTINFYRPSDSGKDFNLPVKLDKEGDQLISTNKIEKGYWKVKVNWTVSEQDYYFEKSLMVN